MIIVVSLARCISTRGRYTIVRFGHDGMFLDPSNPAVVAITFGILGVISTPLVK